MCLTTRKNTFMASSIMSIGHLPRRRPSLDAVSTGERIVAAGLLVTLTVSAALVIMDSRSSDDAAEINVLSATPVVADQALAQSTEAPTFVESGDTAIGSEAVAAEAEAVQAGTMLGGFEIAAGDIQGLYITLGTEPVNMRLEPGVAASIVGQIEPGDAAMALSSGRLATDGTDEWMEVEYLGTTGWVRSDLLTPTDAN